MFIFASANVWLVNFLAQCPGYAFETNWCDFKSGPLKWSYQYWQPILEFQNTQFCRPLPSTWVLDSKASVDTSVSAIYTEHDWYLQICKILQGSNFIPEFLNWNLSIQQLSARRACLIFVILLLVLEVLWEEMNHIPPCRIGACLRGFFQPLQLWWLGFPCSRLGCATCVPSIHWSLFLYKSLPAAVHLQGVECVPKYQHIAAYMTYPPLFACILWDM